MTRLPNISNETVSIIIPVFNVREYLERCLESVFRQSYSNLEIILVDDGSTDGSSELCDVFKQRDMRVSVLHKPNGGVSSARNHGLKFANGRYVAFIDADDEVSDRYIENLVSLLESNDTDVSFVSYKRFSANGAENVVQPCIGLFDFRKTNKRFDVYSGIWCALFKLNVIRKNELHFDERIKHHEDSIFVFQYLSKVRYAVASNKVLYSYCFREGSAVHKYNPEYDVCMKKFFESKTMFLRSIENMPEILLNEIVQMECMNELCHIYEYYQCFYGESNIPPPCKEVRQFYDALDMQAIFKKKSSYTFGFKNRMARLLLFGLLRNNHPVLYVRLKILLSHLFFVNRTLQMRN